MLVAELKPGQAMFVAGGIAIVCLGQRGHKNLIGIQAPKECEIRLPGNATEADLVSLEQLQPILARVAQQAAAKMATRQSAPLMAKRPGATP